MSRVSTVRRKARLGGPSEKHSNRRARIRAQAVQVESPTGAADCMNVFETYLTGLEHDVRMLRVTLNMLKETIDD